MKRELVFYLSDEYRMMKDGDFCLLIPALYEMYVARHTVNDQLVCAILNMRDVLICFLVQIDAKASIV